jgi:hypothetical protein
MYRLSLTFSILVASIGKNGERRIQLAAKLCFEAPPGGFRRGRGADDRDELTFGSLRHDLNTRAAAMTPLVAAIESRNVALMTYLEEHGAREKP